MKMDLADRYLITPNRESGFGRYDVMLKPRASLHKTSANTASPLKARPF